MATSGTIQQAIRTGYRLQITWTVNSQSVANNTSSVTAKVQLVSTGSSYTINSSASKSGSLTINGTKYTFSFTAALSGSQTKTIYEKTVTVSHNADGTKTCAFSATAGINVTLSGTYYGNITASGNGAFNTIARASAIASVTSSVSINGTNTCAVSITRASSGFTHTVTWSFGSYTKSTTGVGTSTSYAIPTSWMNAMPNATSGTAKVTVTTYSGSTKIGSAVSKNFTVTVPTSIVPSISSVAVADTTTNQATYGNMVQGKSKAKFTITAVGTYSSTIKTYKTVFESKNYSGATPTTSTITKSGTATATITVTDSRGRTASTTKTWTVVAYSAPKIISFQGFRCLADGTENYDGTYLSAAINFSISSVNDKNAASYTVEYKLQTATTWTVLTSGSVYAMNDSIISSSGPFGVDNSFDIRLTVKDSFTTIRSSFEIPTAFTLLDFNASGRGIAFGKVSEIDGFECALPMWTGHGEIITSPVALVASQNLDDLLDVGYYIVGNTAVSGTVLNKPPMTTTETSLVEVLPVGDGAQKLQRINLCVKDEQYIWQRLFYSGTWGGWTLVAGCSGWKNLSLDAAFGSYSANTQPKYRVNGNLITVMGAVSPKTAFTSSASKVTFASGLPAYLCPDTPLAFVCQGSGMNRWTCGIETNGTVTISRYGTTEFVSVPTSAWLIFNCTYSI